jgi:4-hydroxy-tetrahydrodipicolinate synthase
MAAQGLLRGDLNMSDFVYMKGVFNITPTPFNPDDSLDEASLISLTNFTIEQGVNGMTILAVLGETSKVTESERDRIIATVLEAADGRVPICVGTTHTGTRVCAAFSKRAQELGARAVMVAPPRLARSSDEALRRHYLTVAEAVDIPIVVQDHPASSGVVMSGSFIANLAREAPQCRFLKLEDDPTPMKASKILAVNPEVQVFGGLGGTMFIEELRHGAVGTMTGFGFPEILVEIYRAFSSGDTKRATEVFDRYCTLMRFENQARINLALRKQIYYMRGVIRSPHVREPYARFDEGTLADLRDLLGRLNLV